MSQPNPYAPPKSNVADIAGTEQSPPLWNPSAASSWSLLLSPVFGAFLHMRNWEALGQPDKAAKSKGWVIAGAAFFILLMLGSALMPESSALDSIGRIGSLGLLVGWYYAIGKSQQTYVQGRFGKSYPRRGWLKPILAAAGVFLAFLGIVFVVAFVVGAASGAA